MIVDSYVPVLAITGLGRDAATEHWVLEDFRRSVEAAGWRFDGDPCLTWVTPADVPADIDMTMCPGVAATAAIRLQGKIVLGQS